MALGKLQISVFDGSEAGPLSGAEITLLEENEDGSVGTPITSLTTDRSGKSEEIDLLCPPGEYAQSPDMPKPYQNYVLRAAAYGFLPVEIRGLQIFEGAKALQNVFMPFSEGTPIGPDDIYVGEHTLWEEYPPKIPEPDVKELPTDRGFIVLSKPVIPETIIVHDGPPSNDNAPDYYIPFKDYIKNVASSEIYSTWPESTIRANVLAILSFTLNRVFTEWYRGKGKNYTITSSTSVDHAFFYGRAIYDSISRVVDEIFTTYVTKQGIRQPLLTQYCDGKKTSCPTWMTQWGSKQMGDQGHSTVDILKNYYGSDIYLAQAEKVAGVPMSYPGYTLTVGSRGIPVREVQHELNRISQNFPAIPKVAEDGIYGPQTEASVKIFQQTFNMPQTGVVDFATWYRISDIYVAVTKMSELL